MSYACNKPVNLAFDMLEPQKKINPTEEIQLITDKRLALESLIHIAEGVHNQQRALSELAIAARPSQDFPKKIVVYFDALEKRMGDTSVAEILQKLETVESLTLKTLSDLFGLIHLDINQLRDDQVENINIAGFTDSISNFKRRTQTALALRFVLKRRGVAIHPLKLPVSQETISEQVAHLKQKERQCARQIKNEINTIINDSRSLLRQKSLSPAMRSELENVTQAMKVNLEHLEKGGSVTEIPNVFEIVTLESQTIDELPQEETQDSEIDEIKQAVDDVEEPDATPEQVTIPQQKSYWWIFKTWLSSPWSTSWRSLRQKYRDR